MSLLNLEERFLQGSYKTNTSSGNGVATAFVLSNTPVASGNLDVYLNGILQTITTDYSVDLGTKTVTFTTAPASAQEVVFKYISKD